MFRSLATAATGMEAQQTKLDVTANNIANVSTNGFKKGRAEFADLMYQNERAAGAATGTGTMAPSGTEIGL
ncbi:MAG TPA: flagellar basal body protein, partial [Kofleriaceae bacterium]|nr:flagellar basal body protein [Kofleriaceae bacterium]